MSQQSIVQIKNKDCPDKDSTLFRDFAAIDITFSKKYQGQ